MIDKRLVPVGGLKKEPYSGSHLGMRYFFQINEDKETFSVFIYPEPWSFEKTPDDQKERNVFPATEEGMDQAIQWLLDSYENQKPRWVKARKDCMHIVNETPFS